MNKQNPMYLVMSYLKIHKLLVRAQFEKTLWIRSQDKQSLKSILLLITMVCLFLGFTFFYFLVNFQEIWSSTSRPLLVFPMEKFKDQILNPNYRIIKKLLFSLKTNIAKQIRIRFCYCTVQLPLVVREK